MNHQALIPSWAGPVSHETMERLVQYVGLLTKWNAAINLIGKTTEADIWTRHVWDSYQIIPLFPTNAKSLADMGSGAGLPGLVIACARPELAITLIERDQRKASFLREAARVLGLCQVTIEAADVTTLSKSYDMVTSRALASLSELCRFTLPLLGAESICLFPKGANFARELDEAREVWAFEAQTIPSKTHEEACIVSLSKLKRREGVAKQ